MSEEDVVTTPDDLATTATDVDESVITDSTQDDESQTDDSVTNTDTDDVVEYADFVVPEGAVKEDVDSIVAELSPLFDEMGLSKEEAQQLIDHRLAQQQAVAQKQSDEWAAQVEEWQEELKGDKKLGGDHWEESRGLVSTALDKLGTPELKQLFEVTGMIQQPEVFKFLHKLGKLTREDNPGGLGSATEEEQDTVAILYPN